MNDEKIKQCYEGICACKPFCADCPENWNDCKWGGKHSIEIMRAECDALREDFEIALKKGGYI